MPPLLPTVLAASTLPLLAIYLDFKSWQSHGTGGTPPTPAGYFKIRRWGLFLLFSRQNLLSTASIPSTGPAYLNASAVPPRSGQRPKSTRWLLPQRQHSTAITPAAATALADLMQELASSLELTKYIHTAPSKTEGGTGPAIYVKPDVEGINPFAHKIFYEIAHVHPAERSLHVYLSPLDAKLVIEKGWAQRFPVPWLAPPGWVHIYAPRDEDEVEIVRKIVVAGISFAVGKDVSL